MNAEDPSGAPSQPVPGAPRPPRRLAKDFRWQSFFQNSADPIFILNRRRRLLFVNRAWEQLTGLAKEEAHVLICRRPRQVSAEDSVEDILAHALTPPPEVLRGVSGRVRRLLPRPLSRDRKGVVETRPLPYGRGSEVWWEVEFLPLLQEGEQGGYLIVGRIRPVPAVERIQLHSPSEKLVNLRQRRIDRFGIEAWSSSLPVMRRLGEQVRLAGQVMTPVLLIGEAGSGKQTLARTIHYLSARRAGACAVLDCQYLPHTAISNLLFGSGRREAASVANEGLAAVYLREPAYLPRDVQLLLCERILHNSAQGPEGETGPRIFAGCVQPPAQAVRTGRLLEELACALGALVIEVPPLRERLAGLPSLIEGLLPRACAGLDHSVTSLNAGAWTLLRGYSWPGNLRELYHVLRAACAHASGEQLRAEDLPAELCRAVQREQLPPRPVDKSLPLQQLLEEAERRLIQLALQRARGQKPQKAEAARLLGIPRPRLWRRMHTLGIADPEQGEDAAPGEGTDEE